MAYIIIQHRVEDYAKWKPVYDEHQSTRKKYGVTCEQLFRSTDDPNVLTVLLEVSDMEKAREFIQSEDLKMAMHRSGVIDTPSFHFLEEVETHEFVKSSM
jgi:hypothetical protein